MVRLDPRVTVAECRADLERQAVAAYGEERLAAMRERLGRTAEWLARIAAAPSEIRGEAPDLSGQESGREGQGQL